MASVLRGKLTMAGRATPLTAMSADKNCCPGPHCLAPRLLGIVGQKVLRGFCLGHVAGAQGEGPTNKQAKDQGAEYVVMGFM